MKKDAPLRAALLAVLENSLRRRVHELYQLPRDEAVERTLELIDVHARAWHVFEQRRPQPAEMRELARRARQIDQAELAGLLRAAARRAEAGR